MSKYNEVMSRIEMTPEMKARILDGIENKKTQKKTVKNTNKILYMGMIAVAACLAVAIGTSVYNNSKVTPVDNDLDLVQGIYTEEDYNSAAELAAASGIAIADLQDIPFEAANTRYVFICQQIAQVSYIDAGENEIVYRMTKGQDDNSGIYYEYENEDAVDINGTTVAIKGNDGKATVAIWTMGEYSYSIYSTSDISMEDMTGMIEKIIK